MKAIKITQKLKENNPKMFANMQVGQIYRFNPPKKIVIGDYVVHGFDKNNELRNEVGFKDLTIPVYDQSTEKLGEIIADGENYTYEVVPLTEKELDAKIPNQMPKMDFKMAILTEHNITNTQVDQVIDAIDVDLQKEILKLMWHESNVIERKNPYLLQFLGNFNLNVNDINNIFKTYYE